MMHDIHVVVALNVALSIAEATCRRDVQRVRY